MGKGNFECAELLHEQFGSKVSLPFVGQWENMEAY